MTYIDRHREGDPQAQCVAGVCSALVPGLVGVYVHGSAALGGFGPASDLDVLVVSEGDADWPTLGSRLLEECGKPRPLELSVVDARSCAAPARPWPYLLHVNSGESRVVLDPGAGDRDLIAHFAVARAAGITIVGKPAVDVFGPVARDELVDYLRDELGWAMESADQRYAVLSACRAVAYAEAGSLLSKVAGGRWWLHGLGPEPLVDEALHAQEEGRDLGPCSGVARSFVTAQLARL